MSSIFLKWLLADISTSVFATPVADASLTVLDAPIGDSTIRNPGFTFSASAYYDTSVDASDQILLAELYEEDSCEIGLGISTCEVNCYPFTSPNTAAKQCISSSPDRFPSNIDINNYVALWVVGTTTASGNVYTFSMENQVEVKGRYIPSIYLLEPGGLVGRYWDNIWFTEEAVLTKRYEIVNFHWGTGAITTYGIDYVSVRWEGKVKPPYTETYTFQLKADDGSRLWIDKVLIIDSWDVCCNETWADVALDRNTYHDIVVEYREIREDAYIELRWESDSIMSTVIPADYLYHADHIKDSPFAGITVGPGKAADFKTRVLDETPFVNNVAGIMNQVFIQVRDCFGNTLEEDAENLFILPDAGLETNRVQTTSQAWYGDYNLTIGTLYEGTFTVNFTHEKKVFPETAGWFQIMISPSVGDATFASHIIGSPYSFKVVPHDTDPSKCRVHGDDIDTLTSGTVGQTATFFLTAKDQYENVRISGTDTITVRFEGPKGDKGVCIYRAGTTSGIYDCSYTLTVSGTYSPYVHIQDGIVANTQLPTINMADGPPDGPSCTVKTDSSPQTSIVAGVEHTFIIQARDEFMNPIEGATTSTASFTVTFTSGNTVVNGAVTCPSESCEGEFTVTYTLIKSGTYEINIMLGSLGIKDNPWTVVCNPAAIDADFTYILEPIGGPNGVGSGHLNGQSTFETFFIVQTRDSFDNDLWLELDPIADTFLPDNNRIECGSTIIPLNFAYLISSNHTGRYNVTYTPTEANANCTLYVVVLDSSIKSGDFYLTVSPGFIDADECIASDIANGIAGVESSFSIQPRDYHMNHITTGGYSFLVTVHDDDGSDVVVGTSTQNEDGTYNISYTTTLSNVYDDVRVHLYTVGGLLGNYYTDYNFNYLHVSGANRVDPVINFDWGYHQEPYSSFPNTDWFSVIWTGRIQPEYTETYTFYFFIYAKSGARLTLHGEVIIDAFDPTSGATEPYGMVQLEGGREYDIMVEFREQTGKARIRLEWESRSRTREIVPSNRLYYKKIVGTKSGYDGSILIIPSHTNATLSTVTSISGHGLEYAIAGESQEFRIQAVDQYGNIQTHSAATEALDDHNEEDQFELRVTPLGGDTYTFNFSDISTTDTPGLYQGAYNITSTGFHTVEFVFGPSNETVTGVNYTIWIYPTTINGYWTNATLQNGVVGVAYSFEVNIRDQFGNWKNKTSVDYVGKHYTTTAYDVDFRLTHTTGTTCAILNSELVDVRGVYSLTYNCTKIGVYTPTISVDGVQLTSIDPDTISFTEAIADGRRCYVTVVPIAATTMQETTFEVQMLDIYSNELQGHAGESAYRFHVLLDDDDGFVDRGDIQGTESANGRYTIAITPKHPGTFTLHVMLLSGDRNTPDGLTGHYYNNRWVMHEPVRVRVDALMQFQWPGLITPTAQDYVSIKWTGYVMFDYVEEYTIAVESNDGSSVRINDTLIIDKFTALPGTYEGMWTPATALLTYEIEILYRENLGNDAAFQIFWESPQQTRVTIPQSRIYSSAQHIVGSPFSVVVEE